MQRHDAWSPITEGMGHEAARQISESDMTIRELGTDQHPSANVSTDRFVASTHNRLPIVVPTKEPGGLSQDRRCHAMKLFAIALALSVVLAGPALAAPGDPRLIQGTLEWPPTLAGGGELFVVLRGDDGRTYYADVMAAQRHVQGPLTAGSRMTLLGLEGTKSHEIVAVALGSGEAAALSLALAQATPTAPPPTPSTPPPAVAPPAATPASGPPVRREEGGLARGEEGRWVTLRGNVYGVAGSTLFLKGDDGHVVVVDLSKLDLSTGPRLRPGSPVAVIVAPVGNKFQARGFEEISATPKPANVPPAPARNPAPTPASQAR